MKYRSGYSILTAMLSIAEHITQTEGFERGKYRMKNRITKLLALLMAAAIVFSLAACGKDKDDTTTAAVTTAAGETTTSEDTTAAAALTQEEVRAALGDLQTSWDGSTENLTNEMKSAVSMYYKTQGKPVQFRDNGFYFVTDESATVAEGTTIPGQTTVPGETTTAAAVKKPESKEEILAAYTAVMNKAKTDKPGYTKYEYQALPKDKINVSKASLIISPLLSLAGTFMTTEDKAKKEPSVNAKGGNMNGFPVKDAPKGCMINNVSAIKTAKCEVLANGNYKLSLVLNDETNPEHYKSGNTAPSNTGGMFTPLSKSDIDPELTTDFVSKVVKEATYSLKYYDCTSVLVYNPLTSQIVSLDQVTYALIDMSGKVIGISAAGTGVLEMYYKFFDLKY